MIQYSHKVKRKWVLLKLKKGKTKMKTKTTKKVKMTDNIMLDNNADPHAIVSSFLTALGKINKNVKDYCMKMMGAIDKVKLDELNEITKLSYEVPRKLDESQYSLVSDKIKEKEKEKDDKRGRKANYWMFKGEIYILNELSEMFGLSYATITYRYRKGWDEFRIWGVDNHRKDHYITENLEMMITKVD